MSKKPTDLSASYFWFGIVGIFLVSLMLRFWGLGRFNTLVFDEVYYAKFANNYLTNTPFFDGHPPLSKYIIAIGIWLGMQLPFGHDTVNGLAGSTLTTWSYRWLNALTGSFIPLVIAALAYLLSHRRSYALIAGLFAALDGLFLVESRYALNNVYLVIFGLLGQCFLLLALHFNRGKETTYQNPVIFAACLFVSGLSFGASASIKWNGLWFLFGAYLVWGAAWLVRWGEFWWVANAGKSLGKPVERFDRAALRTADAPHLLQQLTRINLLQWGFFLAIVPAVVYRLIWIPHLQLNPGAEFWDLQRQILQYHEQVGNGPKIHPYCSNWYSWLLMVRPVAYFYERSQTLNAPVPAGTPPIPAGTEKYIYDVHAMGNPVLWWLSTLAIGLLLVMLVQHVQTWATAQSAALSNPSATSGSPDGSAEPAQRLTLQTQGFWVALYLLLNYAANLIPWVGVTRCTFLYHYMGCSVFALLAIAGFVDHWLFSHQVRLRRLGVVVIGLTILAFVFWLPIYLGLPLSPLGFRLRMWFPTWI